MKRGTRHAQASGRREEEKEKVPAAKGAFETLHCSACPTFSDFVDLANCFLVRFKIINHLDSKIEFILSPLEPELAGLLSTVLPLVTDSSLKTRALALWVLSIQRLPARVFMHATPGTVANKLATALEMGLQLPDRDGAINPAKYALEVRSFP